MSTIAEKNDPRYPIGRFVPPANVTLQDRQHAILTLAEMPEQLREAVRGLDDDQLNTPYREGGWTVRQLVHHIADSHSICLYRIKLILTEDAPVIRGYNENAFALLPDTHAPVEWSLELSESVHARWVMLLQNLTDEQFARSYNHNERGAASLENTVQLYAWHARHHVAHISHLRHRMGW